WSRVIVTTKQPLTTEERDQIKKLGGDITRTYTVIQGFACTVPNKSLETMIGLPFVKHVSSDARVMKTDEYTVSATGADYAFTQNHLDGKGIGVAVIDSGINTGLALPGDLMNGTSGTRVTVTKSFVTGDINTSDPVGHGTHVAGILAGNGKNSTGT